MVYKFPKHLIPNAMGLTMMALLVIGRVISDTKCKFLESSSAISTETSHSCSDTDVFFEKSTLACAEKSVLQQKYEEQIKNSRSMGSVMYFEAFIIFMALVINMYLHVDIEKVVKETGDCVDSVYYRWYSAVYLLQRSNRYYNRKLKSSTKRGLRYHQRHLSQVKRYIVSRIISFVIYTTVIYFTIKVYIFNNKLYERSEFTWESHENYTSLCYPDINCFRVQYKSVKTYFMYLYFILSIGYFNQLSHIFYLSKNCFYYIKDLSSVTGSRPNSEIFYNVEAEAEPIDERHFRINEIYFVVPNFYEYLLVNMIKRAGKLHFVHYVASNIYRTR